MEEKIKEAIKEIFDPEIPVNIYDLGLIYNIDIDTDNNVNISMTLTSPNCPVAESLPIEVEEIIKKIDNVKSCRVKIVFEPPWTTDMMSEEAQLELGLL